MTGLTLPAVVIFLLASWTCLGAHAAELKEIRVHPAVVQGGGAIEVTVSLTKTGVAHPMISASNTSVVDIPLQTFPIVNRSWRTIKYWTKPVSGSPQFIAITATLNDKSVVANLEVTPTPMPETRTFTIPTGDMPSLHKVASENGFVMSAEVLAPETSCQIKNSRDRGLVLSVLPARSSQLFAPALGRCRFTLFGGRLLTEGYTFLTGSMRYQYNRGLGSKWRFENKPSDGPSAAMVLVIETEDRGKADVLEIRSLGIKGPGDGAWIEAFR